MKPRFRYVDFWLAVFRSGRIFLLLLAFSLSACAVRPEPDPPFSLTLLHTNDVHAEYGGMDADGRSCETAICDAGTGGIIRLHQAISALRRDAPETLLLDAGDQFQGTLLFTLHREKIVADLANVMAYDAMVPGNHEFDDGCDRFFSLVRSLDAPVVAANLFVSKDMAPDVNIDPWIIIEKQNRRIGIIGLSNPDTPRIAASCVETEFGDAVVALRKAVVELENQGVNIIIALTHLGLERDLALARQVTGVDVIVGGHTHSLLSNAASDAVDAEGPYPVMVSSPAGEPVLVITAASRLTRLGRLEVTFDSGGRATQWRGDALILDDAALEALQAPPPDPVLVRKMVDYAALAQSLRKIVIGRINRENFGPGSSDPGPMERARMCRRGECLTGNIVADALRNMLKQDVQAALINGGGVRGVFPDGAVTAADVLSVLPFDNQVVIADMPGHVLRAMLEHGLSGFENREGRFLLPAGLRYAFDPDQPVGNRLIAVSIQDKNGKWQRVDPDAVYAIATLSYLAQGGDGYVMLTPLDWKNTGILAQDMVNAYIRQKYLLFPRIEGRVVRITPSPDNTLHNPGWKEQGGIRRKPHEPPRQ